MSDFQKIQRNLTALVEFSRNINTRLDLQYTTNNLLLSCFGKFHTTRGIVALFESGRLNVVAAKGVKSEFTAAFPRITDIEAEQETLKQYLLSFGITIIERIESSGKILGVIGLGDKMNKASYAEDEIEFLRTVVNIAAAAVQNSFMIAELQIMNKSLDSRINRLSSLFELSKEFGLIQEEDRIAKSLLYSILGNFLTSQYAIIYKQGTQTKILGSTIARPALQKIFSQHNIAGFRKPLSRESFVSEIHELDELPFDLLVPMMHQETSKGILLLGRKGNKEAYTSEDIDFISSIGGIALISLENKRLFIEALEKQRMEEELEIAKDIQRNLLPQSIPVIGNFEIEAKSISSKQIGGDYYDIIKLDDAQYAIAIADVSGKGVPAALLMANLQAFLKSVCKQNLSIETATGILNDLVSENTTDGRFITFFWCYLDLVNNSLTYVNAGHNPPILLRDGKISYLDKGGMIFGVMKTMIPYEAGTIQLQKDDVLVLYTDGVSEAKNSDDMEYSEERLESLVTKVGNLSAREVLGGILADVHVFVKECSQSDDITLVVFKHV